MNEPQSALTIQEAAEKTGLTVHTLRYYERIGLFTPIGRATNGHRRYSQQDIYLIRTLNCWRQTGMPLVDIQHYVKLLQAGDATAGERRAMLEAHRQKVVGQMQELQAALDLLDYKVQHYFEIKQKLERVLA